jgi:hypothetical protein
MHRPGAASHIRMLGGKPATAETMIIGTAAVP